MSKYVAKVIALSGEIMSEDLPIVCPHYVAMDDLVIKEFAKNMTTPLSSSWGLSPSLDEQLSRCPDDLRTKIIIVYELLASSINYCYWYGWATLRPSGSGSSYIYKMLDDSIIDVLSNINHIEFYGVYRVINRIINGFKKRLKKSGITMLGERLNHISELEPNICEFVDDLYENHLSYGVDIDKFFDKIFDNFPGFAEDLFLKRLMLLIMQLNRRLSWFRVSMPELIVPADYQIPKMLRAMKCLNYSPSLSNKVDNEELIPKYSREEVEIRAATILTCIKIAKIQNLTCEQVDSVLWLSRKGVVSPHHLTVTTDY